MSGPLPDRPDLDQLRRRAKELGDAACHGDQVALGRVHAQLPERQDGPVTLAIAQLVVAREHGFASWPKLKAAVDAWAVASRPQLPAFLTASVEGPSEQAVRLLGAAPSVQRASIFASAVLGDVDHVAQLLALNPGFALAVDDERGWPPLLYVCYSHWHRTEARRAAGTVEVARLLLDAGASPDTHNGRLPNRGYRSALHGAVSRNNPGITQLLLERGARADDRVSLPAAVPLGDHRCLRLLLDHGASMERTWALEAAVSEGDAEAVRLLLGAAARTTPGGDVAPLANAVIGDAAEQGSVAVIEALLAHGATPAGEAPEGEPPLRRAVRAGHRQAAALLMGRGTIDTLSDVDRLIGACARSDRAEAEQLVATRSGLLDRLTDADGATVVEAAAHWGAPSVALMLDLGFPVGARNDLGETALHTSAYEGRAETVRLLLARGAEVDALDVRFESTALAFATVGSGERPSPDGDWPGTVRALLDAGASRVGVWLSGAKAPSTEVAEVLRSYGVAEESGPSDEPPADVDGEGPADLGPLQGLAAELRKAYQTADLEALASVLDPDVHWGGGLSGCVNRDEVLSWYRVGRDEGFRGHIAHIERVADTIVAGVLSGREAEGVRAAGASLSYQVFRVKDGKIVNITGYTDLATARAAAQRGAR